MGLGEGAQLGIHQARPVWPVSLVPPVRKSRVTVLGRAQWEIISPHP